MKHLLILIVPVLLVLAACSANRSTVPPTPTDSSKPNYVSMYYYATGAMDMQNGLYKTAVTRFTRAGQSDPGSALIRKNIILSNIYLFSLGESNIQTVKQVLEDQYRYISVDEETLEAVHSFYNDIADTTGILSTIVAWQDSYPNPRPYILRFIYEYKFRDYADIRWLYTALDLAWDDPDNLFVLGKFLTLLDDPKALDALKRLHQVSPGQDGDEMLLRWLFDDPDPSVVPDYFLTLKYPEDADLMAEIADWALSMEHPSFFADTAEYILACNDPELTEYLAAYALYRNDTRFQPALIDLTLAYNGDTANETRTALSCTAMSLYNRQKEPIPQLLDILGSTQDYDLLQVYYKAVFASTLSDSIDVDIEAFTSSLEASLLYALPESPRRNYLLWFCGPVEDTLHIQYYSEVKAALVADLMEHGKGSQEDINFMAYYFGTKDRPFARIALLKKGVELYPNSPEMLNNLGYSMLVEGMDNSEAATYINRSLSLDPGNPFYLDSLAWYYYLEGDYQTALEIIQAPLKMEEMPSEIAYHAGLIYMRINDFDNARAMMQEVIRIGDDPSYVEKATQALRLWGE